MNDVEMEFNKLLRNTLEYVRSYILYGVNAKGEKRPIPTSFVLEIKPNYHKYETKDCFKFEDLKRELTNEFERKFPSFEFNLNYTENTLENIKLTVEVRYGRPIGRSRQFQKLDSAGSNPAEAT